MDRLKPYREKIVHFWKKRHLTQIFLLTILVVFLVAILYFGWLAIRANVQSLKEGLSQSTVIYDKNGKIASNVATNRTQGVKIAALPKYVPNAVVAIEDERFYEHGGFDVRGIARAFFGNLFAGRITGGGSTLTQQLTKNALLSSERTYTRKAEELFLAVKIEKVYTKDEILQMYLNQVYFGAGAWGIGNASKKYFNKDIRDVSISEAALMAGLLHAPNYLDPYKNYDLAIKRRNVVLAKMKELGKISASQYNSAIKEKIVLHDGGGSAVDRKYPYYVDAVLNEAINKYGLTQDEILTRGYRIYTEMDQNLQSGLEGVYNKNYLFPRGMGNELSQSGSVLLDPASGGVRALVGGRGEHVFRGYNRATQLKAQPGSSIKPLAVYTPALEEGYDYSSELVDEPTTFGNNYKPENFSRTYSGKVPMYKALEESLNIPAVWTLNKIGLNKGLDSLNRFGIPVENADKNLAIALGGMSTGVSPLQMADAYSAFPNGGKRYDSHLITKIVGPTGNIIAERDPQTIKVTSKEVTNEMTSMLLNVVESGTGQRAHIPGVQIAGKTGSTQLPFNGTGTKDQWMVGYTPNLVGAIWIGFDQTDRQHYLPSSSSANVVPIFKEIMRASLPYIPHESFEVESVNAQLAGNVQSKKDISNQAEKIKKELNANAEKISAKIKEKAPLWKKGLDNALYKVGKAVNGLVEKLQSLGH